MDVTVLTVSNREENLQTAHGIVSVFSKHDIQAWGARNLSDVIARLPGTIQTTINTYSHSTSIRGDTYNPLGDRILVLINGHPVRSDGVLGNIRLVYKSFPVNSIERVEVVRGPGSVLYGSNAVSGVVNIITQKPTDKEVTLGVSAGSENLTGLDATLAWSEGSTYAYSVIEQERSDGSDLPSEFSDGARENLSPNLEHISTYSEVSWNDIVLSMYYANERFNVASAGTGFLEEPMDVEFLNVMLDYKTEVSDQITWSSYAIYSELEGDFNSLEGVLELPGHSFGAESRFDFVHGNHSVLMGAHIDRATIEFTSFLDRMTADNWYGFSEYRYQYEDHWGISGGVQYNDHENYEPHWLFRTGVHYQLSPRYGVKLLYSEAYRTPSLLESDSNTVVVVSNPDLEPEEIQTWDLQWFYQFEKHQGSITLFRTEYENVIVRGTGSNSNSSNSTAELWRNALNDRTWGVEAEGRSWLSSNWDVMYSATWQDLPGASYASPWVIKSGVHYQSHNAWDSGVFFSYTNNFEKHKKANDFVREINSEGPYYLMSIDANVNMNQLLNLSLDYQWQVSGYVHNALNREADYQLLTQNSRGYHVGSREVMIETSLGF